MGKIKKILILISTLLITSCFYHDQTTDLDYMLHTEYEVFSINRDPNIDFSQYVGFCIMPLDKPKDQRGKTCINILKHYLKKAGYIEVTREELVAEPALIPHTTLIGIGYNESYTYGTIQLQVDVYKINKKGSGDLIWSWKAKFDGYPINQDTINPVMEDLFTLEPVDYGRKEKLYKKISAPKQVIEDYLVNLSKARMKLKKEN